MSEHFSKAEILAVEDNPGDQTLIRSFFDMRKKKCRLTLVSNGDEASKKLLKQKSEEGYALVLLDLNLPGKDGREVLREVKSTERLKHIPVIVFSSSESDEDIRKSYAMGANCYIVKPYNLKEFETVMESIENFWLDTVTLSS